MLLKRNILKLLMKLESIILTNAIIISANYRNQLEIIKLFIMKIGRVILIIPGIKSLKPENGKIVLKKLNML
jgi:hypothetical protein